MSTLDQIHESIDAHIAELQREIAALEAARAALRGETPSATKSVASKRNVPTRRRRRIAKSAINGHSVAATIAPGNAAVVEAPVLDAPALNAPVARRTASRAAGGPDGTARKLRSRGRAKPSGSRKSVDVLLADKLEAMLRESEDGLSAITISKRSNAGYNQVLALLRGLEGTGQVRRSGTRRTSLWRVVTDEERIAERAAELEALSAKASTSAGN